MATLGLKERGKFLWEGREKMEEKNITKFAAAGSGIRTYDHRVGGLEP